MSERALDVLREIDAALETAAMAPLLVARFRNTPINVRDFNNAYSCSLEGIGNYTTPRDKGSIRKRAKANRKRNKAARVARRNGRA